MGWVTTAILPVREPAVKVTPDGGVPDIEMDGLGLPVAIGVNELFAAVVKVTLAGLVNTGALFLFSVKLAVMGASVGTVVAPQVPSASTATVETLFRLMT